MSFILKLETAFESSCGNFHIKLFQTEVKEMIPLINVTQAICGVVLHLFVTTHLETLEAHRACEKG